MPSRHQQAKDTGTYESREARLIDKNSTKMILKIKPERMETAQAWITAASKAGEEELVEHFKDEIRRLRD